MKDICFLSGALATFMVMVCYTVLTESVWHAVADVGYATASLRR